MSLGNFEQMEPYRQAKILRTEKLHRISSLSAIFLPSANLKCNIACKGIKRHLQAMVGSRSPSLISESAKKILGSKEKFCRYFSLFLFLIFQKLPELIESFMCYCICRIVLSFDNTVITSHNSDRNILRRNPTKWILLIYPHWWCHT